MALYECLIYKYGGALQALKLNSILSSKKNINNRLIHYVVKQASYQLATQLYISTVWEEALQHVGHLHLVTLLWFLIFSQI